MYSLLVSASIIVLGHGTILALCLVLFTPGYLVVSIIFPGNGEIQWSERIALSLFLSIVFVPILGISLNLSPIGIAFYPSISALVLLIVTTGIAAFWRRTRLPVAERLSGGVVSTLRAGKPFSTTDKLTTLGLVSAILIGSLTLGLVLKPVATSQPFTEFFLLGPDGIASNYPSQLNVSQAGRVFVGIANHEAQTTRYLVRVDLEGEASAYNSTTGSEESIDVNRTTLSWMNATLGDGQSWAAPYLFTINSSSLWKVQFLLFKEAVSLLPYRELHLYVRVD